MGSASPSALAETAERPAALRDISVAGGAVFATAAVGVAALAHAQGGYEATAWAPAGIALVLLTAMFLALGRRPALPVTASAAVFGALGGWAVLSTAWGGLPHQAWRFLDQALIAALALVLGSLAATAPRGRAALAGGVLAGIGACAADIVLRPLVSTAPAEWFHGRTLEGWVGYHNAQASLMAVGVVVALRGLAARNAATRAVSGGLACLFVATLLLTQSRAGVGIAACATVLVLAWARDSALILRAVPLAVAGAALSQPLRDVDRALVNASGVEPALESYARWSLLATALVAASAVPTIRSARVRHGLVAVLAAVGLAGLSVGLVAELRAPEPFGGMLSTFSQPDPNVAAPGSTRLASFSFNGRRDAWRVAWAVGRRDPVVGAGQGTFPRAWSEERRLGELYILQPHNLVLELFSELGVVGVALFAAAIGIAAAWTVRSRDRLVAALALGALFALVAQAAVDWTWSFPGLVVPALLVVGAAAPGVTRTPPGILLTVAGGLVVLAAVSLFGFNWLGSRDLDRAREVMRGDPATALASIDVARKWNRWDPEALELRGLIAERAGAPAVAADDYASAAKLSQLPWLDHFREARAAGTARDAARKKAACATAHRENPAETRLRYAIC